ncbi:60S ribosomal protein L14 [Smittium culicis]|uniref:60S ribosomal protein L14 n=1 Tax=Smittium culicis TaxID=133412 RepID=A0A1R1YE80_9FUNG|nr:60S ribosomal protein L14 [Smittium culicis]OMJ25006.1 60S ribosomal protein L14 [Smittium culicis]
MAAFRRSVEVGRVVVLNSGHKAGRTAVIVDIIDHNRAIIDGPTTGVHRQEISFNRVTLTDVALKKIPRTIGSVALKKAIIKQGSDAAWQQTAWAKTLNQRQTRANLTDFDRFKIMRLKKQQRFIVQKQMAALKKSN